MNLTDQETSLVEAFCKNEKMFDAVKKVVLAGIYDHGTIKAGQKPNPLENAAFNLVSLAMDNPIPDEEIGKHLRGMWAGVNALENSFKRLKEIKIEVKEKDNQTNKAI